MKFPSPETTSPLKPLTVDVFGNRHIFSRPGGGDSGYNSTPGNNGDTHGAAVVEARLLPHSIALGVYLKRYLFLRKQTDNNLFLDDTISVVSEESIMMDQSPILSTEFSPIMGISDSSKGSSLNSSKSGIQLRFMQQILWEAGKLI
jgi:hypothetical protein